MPKNFYHKNMSYHIYIDSLHGPLLSCMPTYTKIIHYCMNVFHIQISLNEFKVCFRKTQQVEKQIEALFSLPTFFSALHDNLSSFEIFKNTKSLVRINFKYHTNYYSSICVMRNKHTKIPEILQSMYTT